MHYDNKIRCTHREREEEITNLDLSPAWSHPLNRGGGRSLDDSNLGVRRSQIIRHEVCDLEIGFPRNKVGSPTRILVLGQESTIHLRNKKRANARFSQS